VTLPAGGLLLLAACALTLTPQQEWVMTKLEECPSQKFVDVTGRGAGPGVGGGVTGASEVPLASIV
jgi:hypothetical protein